jgi:hypothetical protein
VKLDVFVQFARRARGGSAENSCVRRKGQRHVRERVDAHARRHRDGRQLYDVDRALTDDMAA